MNEITNNQLVDAKGLLEVLFPEDSRPSLRWVRLQQKARTIPFIRIGKFVFFDPAKVRHALNSQHTVNSKANGVPR